MSTPIPFDSYEQRLIDNNVIKPKGIKIGFVESKEASQKIKVPPMKHREVLRGKCKAVGLTRSIGKSITISNKIAMS